MELLSQVADKDLQDKLRAYIEELQNEIQTLRSEKKKLQKKAKRDMGTVSSDFSPNLKRRLSNDSFRTNTGWAGHELNKKHNTINETLITPSSGSWVRENEKDLLEFTLEELRPSVESTCWFQQYFLGREHQNFIVDLSNNKKGPAILSIIQEYNGSKESEHARIIVRTKDFVRRLLIPVGTTGITSANDIVRMLRATDESFENAAFRLERNPVIVDKLTDFERAHVPTTFKFGVLYCRAGQTTEEEMFCNSEPVSSNYTRFLSLLGNKIDLKGWKKFSGGLDTTAGLTGENAVFTTWRSFSIIFHVSTLLPHSEHDVQQVEKKRHIGNDIVLIVFQDEDSEPFDPGCISSEYVHCIIVVRACKFKRKIQYQVGVCSKSGVPEFLPRIPQPGVFTHNEDFREYLLCKCVNSEVASYEGRAMLASRLRRTREVLLRNIQEAFPEQLSRRGRSMTTF